ncbi:4Fe-4S binding protein [Clostridium sp. Cult2]|uniref:4Fe-4S binding protein n=1 Tax=Clostridium sp. Cult2 TaxID=2079003 RepID=UPI001F22A171|nr:4Fe-4S binding protein [Clostridium sp. Cult2]MCF6465519.1 polyferredoxin [Clostridium sp. Cult2]
MKLKKRSLIQIVSTILVILICITYYLYINDTINWKILSLGDINPYGGWSALKYSFTDLSYRWRGISKSIALTIGISVTALLMGRFFCGFICPIGALQDFFKYIGTKLEIRERKLPKGKGFSPEILKYFVLLMVLILSILGLGNLISPYSPWLAYLNFFLGLNLNLGFLVLLFIMVSSLFIRRVFCRILCPLGAYQSLLSAIGPMRINRNEECNGCTYCLKNCPAHIERPIGMEISPECIRCLECIETTCIKGTEGYSLKLTKFNIENKRYIILGIILLVSIYSFLPLTNPNPSFQSMAEIGSLKDGVYIGTGIGFGGPMEVKLMVKDNRIGKINIVNHRETTGYYEEVFKTISKEIVETQNFNVDVISGATTTSRGFLNAVKSGISQALESE